MIDLIKKEIAERVTENSKVDKVAEIFGKKLGEDFYIKLVGMEILGPVKVSFNESGLNFKDKPEISGQLLNLLISGFAEIVEDKNAV